LDETERAEGARLRPLFRTYFHEPLPAGAKSFISSLQEATESSADKASVAAVFLF
jgi:hypothetical protein